LDETTHRDLDLDLSAANPAAGLHQILGDDRQLFEVLVGFGWQTDHGVDLDRVPPLGEGRFGSFDHVGVGEGLVDDSAKPVRPGLRREGETRFTDPRNGLGETH